MNTTETETPTAECRVPTEWLDESPAGRAAGRRRQRLLMAWWLFCAKHSGHLTRDGNQADLRRWCWDQADQFLADGERPTSPPAQPAAVAPVGSTGAELAGYLDWLRGQRGECLTAESPPYYAPSVAAECRRNLHRLGLVAATPTGWCLTAAGWNAVEPPAKGVA